MLTKLQTELLKEEKQYRYHAVHALESELYRINKIIENSVFSQNLDDLLLTKDSLQDKVIENEMRVEEIRVFMLKNKRGKHE